MSTSSPQSQIVEHVVLFKVKSDIDSIKVNAMVKLLKDLATIDQVLYLSASPIHRLISTSASASFTHVLHSRYNSKEDLNAYITHPLHLRVIEESLPIWEDILAVDWIAPGTLAPPPGSVAKITLLKVKENLPDDAKTEIMEALKEKGTVTAGENFSPGRAKGFSIASVACFKDGDETEAYKELDLEMFGDYLDDTIVVELVVR